MREAAAGPSWRGIRACASVRARDVRVAGVAMEIAGRGSGGAHSTFAKVSKGVSQERPYRESSGGCKKRAHTSVPYDLPIRSTKAEITMSRIKSTPSASFSRCRRPANINSARGRHRVRHHDAGCFLRTGGLRAADVRIAGPWGPARGALGRAHLQSATHPLRPRRRHRLLETEDGGDACRGALRGE